MPGELEEFQAWYRSQCDGDWEHTYGIHIGTLDNPGWRVEIELAETELADRPFPPIEDLAPEEAWLDCRVANGKFIGHGGALMLERILRAFLDWTRAAQSERAEPVG
jgi:hypothetical protein